MVKQLQSTCNASNEEGHLYNVNGA